MMNASLFVVSLKQNDQKHIASSGKDDMHIVKILER